MTDRRKLNLQGLAKEVRETQGQVEERLAGLEERLDAFEEGIGENSAKLDSVLDALSGMSAGDRPVARNTNGYEPMEMEQGSGVAEIDESGDRPAMAIDLDEGRDIENPLVKEKLDYERFMAEKVRVQILESGQDNTDKVFEIAVNGQSCIFREGEQKEVPRYFVEGLARAKPATYRNEEYVDRDGVRKVRWPMSRGTRYPFAVVHDPNPRGGEWLASVLAQP